MRALALTSLLVALRLSDPCPTSAGCIDYGGFLHWVAEVRTDFAGGVALAGRYGYVADGPYRGLEVIDLSDPRSPSIVGAVNTPGSASDVAVSGGVAYVADGGTGVLVVDVGDAYNPVIVGMVDTPGSAAAVKVSGAYAYVADGNTGLQVIDISSPGARSRSSRTTLSGGAAPASRPTRPA